MSKEVELYFKAVGKWEEELRELARIAKSAELTEEFKWKHPCYTYNNKNILILGAFKDYCLITFFKGVLLKDTKKLLVHLSKNTQSERVIKITDLQSIKLIENAIVAYIKEAIDIEISGQKVSMKKTEDYKMPQELVDIFNEENKFKEAFYQLTPGRQRGYLLHYSSAKQSKTRISRIKASMERIYMGKGLNDCICGLSKKMPRCDGSHKQLKDNDYP